MRYRKVRNWNAMFQVADEMKAAGVKFDAVIYSTVIGACADAGESARAFELFEVPSFFSKNERAI